MSRLAVVLEAIFILSGWTGQAEADFYDGDQLYQECQGDAEARPISHGFCIGYITGA
jgi:hypothetical protein